MSVQNDHNNEGVSSADLGLSVSTPTGDGATWGEEGSVEWKEGREQGR